MEAIAITVCFVLLFLLPMSIYLLVDAGRDLYREIRRRWRN